jgi:hypothetical protein
MRASILLSTLALALVAQASSLTGPRALVLLDTLDDADVYTDLWSDLEGINTSTGVTAATFVLSADLSSSRRVLTKPIAYSFT